MAPLISIITATKNAESVIPELLESLETQRFLDFEWIVVDSLSTDNTLNLVKSYSGKLRYVCEKDSGIYDAWNKAIAIAKGEWVIFLGADDRLFSANSLEILCAMISMNPSANMILYPTQLRSPWGNRITPSESLAAFDFASLKKAMNFCHQGVAQRRSDIINNGGFNSHYRVCGDYDAMLKSLVKVTPKYLSIQPVVSMALGGLSTTFKGAALAYREMAQIQKNHFTTIALGVQIRSLIFRAASCCLPNSMQKKLETIRVRRMIVN